MVTVGGMSGGVRFESLIGAFRVAGEDVKIDLITNFMSDLNIFSAADSAKKAYNAANAALREIAEYGADLSGIHLLSTNSSKNVGSLNGSYEELFDKIAELMVHDNYIEFFIVTVDGVCRYAAVVTKTGEVGTFPENTELAGLSESCHGQECNIRSVTGVLDYDGLYSSAVGTVGG